MAEMYYRIHNNPNAPTFSADHAYSGLWGSEFSADGSQTECHDCSDSDGSRAECRTCDGTGWEDAPYGYSCCESATDLLAYFSPSRGGTGDSDPVVIFEGERVGTGFDGEPLAIPTGTVRWTTIAALRTERTPT